MMPYRKVTYLEQMWYLLRFKIRELLGKEKNDDGISTAKRDR